MITRLDYIERYVKVREEERLLYESMSTPAYSDGIRAANFLRELSEYEREVPRKTRAKFRDFSDTKILATGIFDTATREQKDKMAKSLRNLIRVSPVLARIHGSRD